MRYTKKLFALLMLAVFVVSIVPISLAEELSGNSADMKSTDSVSDDDLVVDLSDAEDYNSIEADAKKPLKMKGKEIINNFKDKKKEINKQIEAVRKSRQLQRVAKNRPELVDKIKEFSEENKGLIEKHLSRARYEWCMDNPAECKEKIKDIVEEYKPAEKRKISKEKLAEAKDRYLKAKDAYKDNFKEAKEKRERFLELKKEKASDEEMLVAAKDYLNHKIDLVISHFEKVKERVQSSENIAEERVQEETDNLNENIATLEEMKTSVDAAESKEDIKEIASELKNFWGKFRSSVKGYALGLINEKIKGVIVNGNDLEKKLDMMLNGVELRGLEITDELDAKIDKFSGNIERARQSYQESTELLAKAKELRKNNEDVADEIKEEYKGLVEQSKEKMMESKRFIKDAHDLLKDIIKELKEANKGKLPEIAEESE
ncbi:MAG: hypothetical protein ABIG89_06250 [Candidatus Woesearchaeota archaeon]